MLLRKMECYPTWETFCVAGELEFASLRSAFHSNSKTMVVIIGESDISIYDFTFTSNIYLYDMIRRIRNKCFSCWLQMDSKLMLGQYAPITLMVIITIMLIEAAGSVDESTMSKLPRK